MKIFVTGATGFVGSHLCDKLKSEGHEVFILVRNPKKLEEFKVPGTIVKGSLAFDKENNWIDQLPNDLDAVIHIAGIVHSYDPKTFYEINTLATERLVRDLGNKFNELNFILISSMAASGPSNIDKPILESDPPNPVSDYGQSKLLAERSLKDHAKENWKLSILRPPIVIGPRDPAVLDIFKMVHQGFTVMAGMDGLKKKYSYVCVFDLVSVIIACLDRKDKELEVYFTAAPTPMNFGELIEVIAKEMGKKRVFKLLLPQFLVIFAAHLINLLAKILPLDVRLTKDKIKEITPKAWLVSGEKSQKDLGIQYEWFLEETVKETLKDYKNRDWL